MVIVQNDCSASMMNTFAPEYPLDNFLEDSRLGELSEYLQ